MPVPDVLFGLEMRERMLRGFGSMARLLALTLGPRGSTIVSQRVNSTTPETIDDAATIARRILQFPDRVENVGAMVMRHIVWHMRESQGDGSATASVLAHAIAREMHRLIVAGADPLALQRGIHAGVDAVCAALDDMSRPLDGAEHIAGLATAAINEPDIGELLGEMFDVLGPHGNIVIQPYAAAKHDRMYYEGSRFPGEYVSSYLVSDPVRHIAALSETHVLVADVHFHEPSEVATVLDMACRAGVRNLFIICKNAWDRAIGALVYNNENEQSPIRAFAATIRPVENLRRDMMMDIALLTGGTFVTDEAGTNLGTLTLQDLGYADRIVATRNHVTIIGGGGSRGVVRRHTQDLQARMRMLINREEKELLRERIARLTGGIGELRVAAFTERERKALTEKAAFGVKVIQVAVEGGIVPGGGAAYLAAASALDTVQASGDEVLGVRVIARALEEPMRVIAESAGVHAPLALAECLRRGQGYGLDARRGQVVDMVAARIVDSTVVTKEALRRAASGALMLLTSDALVLHKEPPTSYVP